MDNIDIIDKIKLLSVSNLIEQVILDENATKNFLEKIYTIENAEKLKASFETIKDVSASNIEEFQREYGQNFDCGDDSINLIIQEQLFLQTKLNYAKAFCVTHQKELIGVCSLSLSSLDIYLNEESKATFPCVKLNFLAVDTKHQGQNYAKYLLIHALHNARFISHIVGCLGVYLETQKDLIKLYEEVGFECLISEENMQNVSKAPMWLNIETIKKVLD